MVGVVVAFDQKKRFGFILAEDRTSDEPLRKFFVHHSAIVGRKYLFEGQIVSFEVGEFRGRPVATSVTVTRDIPAADKIAQAEAALALLGAPSGSGEPKVVE